MRNENSQFMRVPSLDMTWYQAENLDVLGLLAVITAIFARLLFGRFQRALGTDVSVALFAALSVFFVWG